MVTRFGVGHGDKQVHILNWSQTKQYLPLDARSVSDVLFKMSASWQSLPPPPDKGRKIVEEFIIYGFSRVHPEKNVKNLQRLVQRFGVSPILEILCSSAVSPRHASLGMPTIRTLLLEIIKNYGSLIPSGEAMRLCNLPDVRVKEFQSRAWAGILTIRVSTRLALTWISA